MERFDVAFANRFIQAYYQWHGGRLKEPIILQYILLAMNAHINLDLAIAAMEVSDTGSLESM